MHTGGPRADVIPFLPTKLVQGCVLWSILSVCVRDYQGMEVIKHAADVDAARPEWRQQHVSPASF